MKFLQAAIVNPILSNSQSYKYTVIDILIVSWSLTSPFSTNMAISEKKGQ